MNDYQKVYNIIIKTHAPLHIGSGTTLTKKDYVFDRKTDTVKVINMNKLLQMLASKNQFDSYRQFMCGTNNDLNYWLMNNGFTNDDIENLTAYTLDCSSTSLSANSKQREIKAFVKDAYGNAYIPGSSVKGCLRTALLAYFIEKGPEQFSDVKRKIINAVPKYEGDKSYLNYEVKQLESIAFNKADRNHEKIRDAVNDIMQGIIISDSDAVPANRLTLCNKLDKTIKGVYKDLPIFFESIMPDTLISLTLTIDSTFCKRTINDIKQAINCFGEAYYNNFLVDFDLPKPESSDTIYLGGNCGFATKTVLYNLFEKQQAVKQASIAINNIKDSKKYSKNKGDVKLGISPHTVNLTRFAGCECHMGEAGFIVKTN